MISPRLRSWHERSCWRMPQLMAINSPLTVQTLLPKPCGPLLALWPILALPEVMQRSSATWCMANAQTLRRRLPRLWHWRHKWRQQRYQPQQALEKLLALAMAVSNDFDRFERQVRSAHEKIAAVGSLSGAPQSA